MTNGQTHTRHGILVFGGARGMGLWIAQFLARRGHAITIVDPYEKTPDTAATNGFEFARLDHTSLEALLDPSKHLPADVVVVAVPMDLVDAVGRAIGPFVKPSGLLMDVTSLKAQALRTMEDATPKTVAVLGTHPMFAPRVPSFLAQTCVLVESATHPPGGWSQWWAESVEAEGGIIVRATAAEHDAIMLNVQVLLHYAIMAFASTLAESQADISRTYHFRSPLWEVAVGLVARIFTGNPDLYFMIQQHPEAPRLRSRLMSCAGQLTSLLARGDRTDFRQFAARIHDHFGQSNLSAYSDTIASLFSFLASHKADLVAAKGQHRCVRNTGTNAIHYGLIERITADHVVVTKDRRCVTIALKKARLVSSAEEATWKASHLPCRKIVMPLLVPGHADEATYRTLVSEVPGVTAVSIEDVYAQLPVPHGFKKVTLRITLVDGGSFPNAVARIEDLVTGLGCAWRPSRPQRRA